MLNFVRVCFSLFVKICRAGNYRRGRLGYIAKAKYAGAQHPTAASAQPATCQPTDASTASTTSLYAPKSEIWPSEEGLTAAVFLVGERTKFKDEPSSCSDCSIASVEPERR